LTITPTSHGAEMHLSVCVCPDNVPAVDEIATGIVDALGTLVAAAHKSPRGQGRSVVTEMTAHAIKRGQARG
jgi:diacylglycerol O-acyltransferase